MTARVCMCGQCWIGADADWADVERSLVVDGLSSSDARRVRRALEGRFNVYRTDPPASPCSSKIELMIFKEEARSVSADRASIATPAEPASPTGARIP